MCLNGKTLGLAALTFGVGVALCLFLPAEALVVIEAAVIIGAGIMIFVGR